MIDQQATADDFARWEAHAKTCSIESLRYIVMDCRQAAEAMKGWNEPRELYYRDQGFTYGDELSRRERMAT